MVQFFTILEFLLLISIKYVLQYYNIRYMEDVSQSLQISDMVDISKNKSKMSQECNLPPENPILFRWRVASDLKLTASDLTP